ncbi:MAG: DUF4340 domain-containing protein [Ruminococcaceae bacterium]|nr:DUF4340 domain-containing protein [Oscillospiraceae bacterium]
MKIKQQKITAIVLGILFVALVIVYFTVIAPMISGEEAETEPLETVEGEVISSNNRYLMFPKVERSGIQAIEVHNEHGSFTFYRDASDNFQLSGFEGMTYNQELFASFVVTAGNTLAMMKVTDNATPEQMAEYGLDDPQAYWILTTTTGETHQVNIGDILVTEGGYYCSYEGRDSVYILSTTLASTMLQPVEKLIMPLLTAGMSQNDYFYAENFMIFHGEDLFIRLTNKTPEEMSNPEAIVEPKMTFPSGYEPNTELYYGTLYNFASMVGTETVKIGTDEEILKQYGLYEPAYTVAYNFNDYSFFVFVSEKQEDGTYYATSNLYNFQLIAKVGSDMLGFLDERFFTWISDYPFQPNIKEVDTIQILSPDGTTDVHFKLHHGIDSDTNPTLEADIVSADGRRGFINNDYISNFRQFYKTLLSIQLHEETTPLTEEQITDIVKDDNLLLTFSYKLLTGEEVEYKFYQYSTRRALVTINGVGEFYVYVDMSDKIISDTEKVLVGLDIDSYGKK